MGIWVVRPIGRARTGGMGDSSPVDTKRQGSESLAVAAH